MIAIEKTKRRTRLINPEKNPGAARKVSAGTRAAKKRTRRNPVGELITLGAINPERKEPVKKAKKNRAAKPSGKKAARAKNPAVKFVPVAAAAKPRKKRRARNPEIIGPAKTMLESGAYALVGLVATRQLPQMVLKENNSGWKGYLANAGVALGVSLAAGKFAGREAANAMLIGGGLYLVNRILAEQLSPIGKVLSLSGVGDAQAAGRGLGRVRKGYYPLPVDKDKDGNVIVPQTIVDAVKASLPAPAQAAAASKVSGVSRRMAAAL
jgi:hypothetical protein